MAGSWTRAKRLSVKRVCIPLLRWLGIAEDRLVGQGPNASYFKTALSQVRIGYADPCPPPPENHWDTRHLCSPCHFGSKLITKRKRRLPPICSFKVLPKLSEKDQYCMYYWLVTIINIILTKKNRENPAYVPFSKPSAFETVDFIFLDILTKHIKSA